MVEKRLVDVFEQCLERLARGQTIEDCLAAFPDEADQLRPLLYAGMTVRRAEVGIAEASSAQERARRRYEEALRQPRPARRIVPWPALATLAAAFVLVFGVLAVVAQSALPGEGLFGLKRLTEDVRLALLGGAGLADEFAQRRIEEISLLLIRQQEAEVEFEGLVETIVGEDWLISRLPVVVPTTAQVSPTITLGHRVRVRGVTSADGRLIALSIEDLTVAPLPTPTATAVPSLTLGPTTVPTQTPAPLTATLTVTPTPTSTASPTSTPSPTETGTPTATTRSATQTPTSSACVPTQPPGWVRYSVRAGDTLSGLAALVGATVAELMSVNCIEDARFVFVGQPLYLPRLPASGGDSGTGGISPPPGGGDSGSPPVSDNANDNDSNDNSDDDDGDDDNDDDDDD